ncbi:MAG TPA: hypothetical protein VGR11_16520, partial [Solirubrobacteraceae bacterium]|nr:hypothetical protein [Solirubrobacteraceae bacterium]
VLTPPEHAAPARRLTLIGAVAELGSVLLMEQRLGELGEPYSKGRAGVLKRTANGLVSAGALAVVGWGHRSRASAVAGGVAVLAGAALERFSVFQAGFQSAADPKYVVAPQRGRIDAGERRGASRKHAATP